jgi:manganese-dependent inorganic pyrophosphatase
MKTKKVYVIGHKNPDTDSIVSAIAYAELKRELGMDNCFPARAGKLNLQSEYILNRFNVPVPEFISNLIPRVSHYMSREPSAIPNNTTLWNALEILDKQKLRMLPIVDSEKKYISTLHYTVFAENLMRKMDPHKRSVISTSISHLVSTLKAQPVVAHHEDEIFRTEILVAASSPETVKEFINSIPAENTTVISGDREDVHAYAINRGIKCLIVTGGRVVKKELRELAAEKGVSILITPFDTQTTSWLTIYSTPVENMGDAEIRPVKDDDYIKNIKELISSSVSRSLSVVDENNMVSGIITQGDLMRDPNIEIIMVDHNEISQSPEGIENYRILEIIDHHRLGNVHTSYPIRFINLPVGSTSTIVATLYRDYRVPLKKETASILLAGILSDTLILQSATTTPTDRELAEYLSEITDLDIQEFGSDILSASSLVSKKPVDEILNLDLKEYTEGEYSFAVSQVEVNSQEEIMDRKEEILKALEKLSGNKLFSALMVTDITILDSLLFITGNRDFINKIGYPRVEDNIFLLKDILSRKKQLLPYLMELVKRFGA